jgi:hypothetical protein
MCAVNPLPLQVFKEFQYGFEGITLQVKKCYVATESKSNAEVVILRSHKGRHPTEQLEFFADFHYISLKREAAKSCNEKGGIAAKTH